MAIEKITSADLAGKGVIGLPDIPALTTSEMQNKFEETARDVIIPKVNEIIDNTYIKSEVDEEIDRKVVEIGAGDMAKAVYDTNNNGKVDNAENADKLGGIDAATILARLKAAEDKIILLEGRQNITVSVNTSTGAGTITKL